MGTPPPHRGAPGPPPPSAPPDTPSNPTTVGLDLVFEDAELEREFLDRHQHAQISWDIILALGIRAVGWGSTVARALQRGHRSAALVMAATGLPSGLLPLLALAVLRPSLYARQRHWWVAVANAAQFFLVGRFFGHLYPVEGDLLEGAVPLGKAVAAVLGASGPAFMMLTAFMGALPFRWLFPTQALYLAILAVSNRGICARSPALRRAYAAVAAPWAAGAPSLDTCVASQAALQLGLGLWLPCVVAYTRELQARRAFLAAKRGEAACAAAALPRPWDVALYSSPALVFPWVGLLLSGANLGVPEL